MTFATKYGPWALVAGASDGLGAAFAAGLAERGVNVVLLARRQAVLDQVAADIESRTSAQTRTLAVDLAQPGAAAAIAEATADLEIGFLVYCAGADPNYQPFLANPIEAAEAMVQRNCMVPCSYATTSLPRWSAEQRGIVIFGSGAGLAGGSTWSPTALPRRSTWSSPRRCGSELHDKGVDVVGLILGKTDTPALRQLEHSRGQISSLDEVPAGAVAVDDVIAEAFENLTNGRLVRVAM